MAYIKQKQLSNFQQFVLNKLYAHNQNVHEIPLSERLKITLEVIKENKKAYELMSKNDNFYLNFLMVSKVVLLPTDKEVATDLIDIAFKVILKETCLHGYDSDLHKLLEVHNLVKETIYETNKELKQKQQITNKKYFGVKL